MNARVQRRAVVCRAQAQSRREVSSACMLRHLGEEPCLL